MSQVFFDGKYLCVQLVPHKDYKIILDIAKKSDYFEYIQNEGIFLLPPTKSIARKLNENGYTFDSSAKIFIENKNKNEIKYKEFEKLYPFQKEGVLKMLKMNSNILLADEMGLGKTVQGAAYLKLKKDSFPALVISPASLKENWRKEIKRWTGKDAYVIEGRKPEKLSKEFIEKYPVFIINYDILGTDNTEDKKYKSELKEEIKQLKEEIKKTDTYLRQPLKNKLFALNTKYRNFVIKVDGWCDELIKLNFKTIIGDEVQYISGIDTIRTRAMTQISFALPEAKKILISGTPYETKTAQFYPCLHILNPKYFNNEYKFKMRYCDPVKTFFGWKYEGLSNAKELHEIISKFMIRRFKKEVLKDLPPKIRSVIPMKVSAADRKIYDDIDNELEIAIINKEKNALNKIEALKQASFKAKLNSMINWIKEYLEINEKLVVFIWHQEACQILEKEFGNECVSVTGATPVKERQKMVDKFQENSKIRLFIGNIKSAGVGLTLTASKAVAFMEFGSTAPGMEQAEDRCHRIGQKADSVLAYYLIMENTIDEQIMEVLNKRNKDLKRVLNDEDEDLFEPTKELEFSKLILEEYKKTKNL